MTSPVSLIGDFSRDMLTTASVDVEMPRLYRIPDMPEYTESNPIVTPEYHVMSKIPVVSSIFGSIGIPKGSISEDDVDQSINGHHHLSKI